MRQFTRKEIQARLQQKIAAKKPLVIGGAGIGLVAKIADQTGIDLIVAYNSGVFRMDGHPSCTGILAYGDCNEITLSLGAKILPVVSNTPVLGGLGAAAPYCDMDTLISQVMDTGFSGVTNFPTAGALTGLFRYRVDTAGTGYPEEIKMIAACNRRDIFTMAYAYTADEVRGMIQAGADVIGAHVGATSGGTVGFCGACSLDEACDKVQQLYEIAIAENPDIIFVCHGGPLENAATVQVCYDRTGAQGFIGASSIERLPAEKVIYDTIKAYQKLTLRSAN